MRLFCPTRLLISIGLSVLLCLPVAAQGAVCVLVPHFKDEYWLSVGYGLEQEARAAGLDLWFREAGGYRAREAQITQIDDCTAAGAEAILIGTVSSDHPDLLAAVARAAQTAPVYALVNALDSDALSGRAGVDWHAMGLDLGRAIAAAHPAGSPPLQAVLVSGPRESGWVRPVETGLREALSDSAVRIVDRRFSDTGLREQFETVAEIFESFPNLDMLIGSAPAIEAAMGILATHPERRRPELVATYVTHSVRRGLSDGQVALAPFDDPVGQGRMAVRMVLKDDSPFGDGPPIRLIRPRTLTVERLPLSPADYFPSIE
ncbi:MAG: TMAO reductase system periplasmic protein TorT [Paracoccus sp. (in: a-proteobacteria)]|nr:TMAO reductase system periplasmic protein TorT [Paracoccus sp. (in: a-proteobacteria)]